jgi:hypothetical protein
MSNFERENFIFNVCSFIIQCSQEFNTKAVIKRSTPGYKVDFFKRIFGA